VIYLKPTAENQPIQSEDVILEAVSVASGNIVFMDKLLD